MTICISHHVDLKADNISFQYTYIIYKSLLLTIEIVLKSF